MALHTTRSRSSRTGNTAKLSCSRRKFGASNQAFIEGKFSNVAVTQRRDNADTFIVVNKGEKTRVQIVKIKRRR